MISIDYTIILVILNFVVLILVLDKLLYKPIVKFLHERQNEIAKDIEEAKLSKEKAKELAAKKEEELKKTVQEANVIKQKAKKEAQLTAEEILKEAHDSKKKIISDTEKQLEHEKEKVLKEVKGELAELIEKVSEKVIHEKLDDEKDAKLIDEILSNEVKIGN